MKLDVGIVTPWGLYQGETLRCRRCGASIHATDPEEEPIPPGKMEIVVNGMGRRGKEVIVYQEQMATIELWQQPASLTEEAAP